MNKRNPLNIPVLIMMMLIFGVILIIPRMWVNKMNLRTYTLSDEVFSEGLPVDEREWLQENLKGEAITLKYPEKVFFGTGFDIFLESTFQLPPRGQGVALFSEYELTTVTASVSPRTLILKPISMQLPEPISWRITLNEDSAFQERVKISILWSDDRAAEKVVIPLFIIPVKVEVISILGLPLGLFQGILFLVGLLMYMGFTYWKSTKQNRK